MTWFKFNTEGNLTATVDPLGNRTTRVYDAASRLMALTNSLVQTTSYEYDNLNRVTQIQDATGGITQFTYDANGNLLTVTDANSHTTTYTYDVQDRLETRMDPLGHGETYTYDPNGNLTAFLDRKGQISQFTYDAFNRRTLAQYADGSSTSFVYDAVGRLNQASDSVSGLIRMDYDNLDRLTSELSPQGVISYTYDAISRRTSISANGLPPVTYGYDDASRLTQVAQGPQVVGLGYDDAGRRTSLAYPNGTNTAYQYDNASRVTEILHDGPAGIIEDLSYTYDAGGNRISFSRSGPQADLPAAITAAHNAANQLLQFNTDTLTYDLNGNLTFDGERTYTWDARNRLIQMSSGSLLAEFEYDALGRRVKKMINGNATEYLYDDKDILAEISNGAVNATYLRSGGLDQPILRSSSVAEYYHADSLGSIVALTDNAGTVSASYSFDGYGNTVSDGTSDNPFQYTGRENDFGGLYYYRARYYNPEIGRFLSEDPLFSPLYNARECRTSYSPDVSRYIETERSLSLLQSFPFGLYSHSIAATGLNPQHMHSFNYANNNPVNRVDPLGLLCKPQTPGCDVVGRLGGVFTSPCGKKCCNEHDSCYCRSSGWCDSSSWWNPFPNDTSRNWDCDVCNYNVKRCLWKAAASGGNGRGKDGC